MVFNILNDEMLSFYAGKIVKLNNNDELPGKRLKISKIT